MRRGRALLGVLMLASACGDFSTREVLPPEGEILLGVSTDAWLPRGAGEPSDPLEAVALFEKLRVEFFAPGESEPCRDCVRDFALDNRTANEGRASVGFIPRPGISGYRARVRIYHSGLGESSAEPRERATIEAVVALPPVAAEGVVRIHVVLRTDDLGRPRGTLDAPIAAEPGPPPTGLAGTWNAGVRRSCPEPAGQGEACVPGGAFWMGDPGFSKPFERLVAVSPFYIDVRETTVADIRASGVARAGIGGQADPVPQSPADSSSSHHCTWTAERGANEDLPISCVGRTTATSHCEKLGRRLPSEVEIEFVAGARRSAPFPWGEQLPTCADAVYGRSSDTTLAPIYRSCLSDTVRAGVAKPGSGRLDRVKLPDGNEIVDLAGNVSEWVLDEYTSIGESCLAENPALDPICRTATTSGVYLMRGSSWGSFGASDLRSAVRASFKGQWSPQIGFRCARDAK